MMTSANPATVGEFTVLAAFTFVLTCPIITFVGVEEPGYAIFFMISLEER